MNTTQTVAGVILSVMIASAAIILFNDTRVKEWKHPPIPFKPQLVKWTDGEWVLVPMPPCFERRNDGWGSVPRHGHNLPIMCDQPR